ncbi:MAG: YbaB/EbfC family DNA-binding protein [Kibdelosporangium sp.]
MISGKASDSETGTSVTVSPGGGLTGLTLTRKSMRLGGRALAVVILDLVDRATAEANLRAGREFGLSRGELEVLGMGVEARLAAAVESTIPATWRV